MELHPLFYLIAFVSVLTASFFSFVVITFLIVVHEIGHVLLVFLFGGTVFKILIYPLGGISKFSTGFNLSIGKDFLILIFGPLFQMLAWIILCFIFPSKTEIITAYNFGILTFNLLPIYPLDGGKLLVLFFHYFFPYRKSFYMCFYFGYCLLFIILLGFLYSFSLNLLFLFLFLIIKLTKEVDQVPYFYDRFLLERYLNHYSFKKSKIVNSKEDFQRSYRHLIKDGSNYYLEEEYLEKKFKKC